MSETIFRRIHGHIVPIKLNQEQKKGAAKLAGAVGIVAGTHVIGQSLVKKSDKYGKAASDFFIKGVSRNDRFINTGLGYYNLSDIFHKKERKFLKYSAGVNAVGSAGAAALAASGTKNLLDKTKLSENQKNIISGGAGVGVGASVYALSSKVNTGKFKIRHSIFRARNAAIRAFRFARKFK